MSSAFLTPISAAPGMRRGVHIPNDVRDSIGVDVDVILDGEEDEGVDKCAQCGANGGKLWTESTWPALLSIDFLSLLPGHLPANEIEAAALVPLLMHPARGGAGRVLGEIFDLVEEDKDTDKDKPEFKDKAGWKRGDALCGGCLERLVGDYLWRWAYERKVEDGWKPTQNCWYGYNCKTQVHNIAHARDKNHLCVPIR
ncbi:hypothetical protein DFH06DRAFT_1314232 [Mycena polygramma]|nr:hypothetical protein DFH06DRAFT_1314232 [Mycena polygramma]